MQGCVFQAEEPGGFPLFSVAYDEGAVDDEFFDVFEKMLERLAVVQIEVFNEEFDDFLVIRSMCFHHPLVNMYFFFKIGHCLEVVVQIQVSEPFPLVRGNTIA